MKRLLLLALSLAIFARENPFVLPSSSNSQSSLARSTSQSSSAASVQKVLDLGFMDIRKGPDMLIIHTKDPLKRHFIIDRPKKMVLDFASRHTFETKKVVFTQGAFKDIAIGSHGRFYRVAVAVEKTCDVQIDRKPGVIELFCQKRN